MAVPTLLDVRYIRMFHKLEEADIEVGLWLLLDAREGYWVSAQNVSSFLPYLRKTLQLLSAHDLQVDWIVVDLEPPRSHVKAFHRMSLSEKPKFALNYITRSLKKECYDNISSKFGEVIDVVHDHGAKTLAAMLDLVLFDVYRRSEIMQHALGTPVTSVKWDLVSPMVYTSLIHNYARGLITWTDARYWVYFASKLTKHMFGKRAAISLGAIDPKSPADPRYFNDPLDLLPDVSAALAGGIPRHHVSLYKLEGILRSSLPSRWFEMVLHNTPKIPPRSTKVTLFYRIMSDVGLPLLGKLA